MYGICEISHVNNIRISHFQLNIKSSNNPSLNFSQTENSINIKQHDWSQYFSVVEQKSILEMINKWCTKHLPIYIYIQVPIYIYPIAYCLLVLEFYLLFLFVCFIVVIVLKWCKIIRSSVTLITLKLFIWAI